MDWLLGRRPQSSRIHRRPCRRYCKRCNNSKVGYPSAGKFKLC